VYDNYQLITPQLPVTYSQPKVNFILMIFQRLGTVPFSTGVGAFMGVKHTGDRWNGSRVVLFVKPVYTMSLIMP